MCLTFANINIFHIMVLEIFLEAAWYIVGDSYIVWRLQLTAFAMANKENNSSHFIGVVKVLNKRTFSMSLIFRTSLYFEIELIS